MSRSAALFILSRRRRAMFFLCSVFWCGQVSSWCVSDLLRLASLATTRYSFSLLYILAQKLVRCSCSYVLSEMVSSIYVVILLLGALFLFLFFYSAELLILLSCNNESYLMQMTKKKFAPFFPPHCSISTRPSGISI